MINNLYVFSGFIQYFRSPTVDEHDVDRYVDGVHASVYLCSDFEVQGR